MSVTPKEQIRKHFCRELRSASRKHGAQKRVGAEFKFPLVNHDGTAAPLKTTLAFWEYLEGKRGWRLTRDPFTGNPTGACKPGPCNDSVASCETGFCKAEFSLAHTADLFELERLVTDLYEDLRVFSEANNVYFLGYGMQPVTAPDKDLLFKKSRTSVWDGFFATHRHIPPERGHDMHLFTVNAASHVHLDMPEEELISAINVLNGFAGAQIALTAHSPVWQNKVDPEYRCVAEKLWDWWLPKGDRVGVPEKPFRDIRDYVYRIADLQPIYVERNGEPIVLEQYKTFAEYYAQKRAVGRNSAGEEVTLSPEETDLKLHHSCYWFNTRISRYYTMENRLNDQQPPQEILVVPALTLGLTSVLPEAAEELDAYDWQELRLAKEAACRQTLNGATEKISLYHLAGRLVELAEKGLKKRGLGEESFLEPLRERLRHRKSPADEAVELFEKGGCAALVEARKI